MSQMLPNIDHLYLLRNDPDRFEAERNKVISAYIKSLPEERRNAAYAMQCKIDVARQKMSQEEFLRWMSNEAYEISMNIEDQFNFIGHKAEELKKIFENKPEE